MHIHTHTHTHTYTHTHAHTSHTHSHTHTYIQVKYTTYDECDLEACSTEMSSLLNQATQQMAVHRKYSNQKFGAVATLNLEF